MSALSRAAKSGDIDNVEHLIHQGQDINALDEEETTPVQNAAQAARWDVVKYLVAHGADINAPDREGKTVMQRATDAARWDVVKYLIVMGGDVNILDSDNVSPMEYAIRSEEWEIAKYMAEKGGNIDRLTSQEKDALLEKVIEAQNVDIRKTFYNVIRVGNTELLEMLIRKEGLNTDALKLDNVLAKAYEELKIQNVPLSPEIEVEIEMKLTSLRFSIAKNKLNEKKVDSSLEDVRKRIEMVCSQIEILCRQYSGADGKEVDDRFLLIGKFLVQNVRILKRQLRSTYHRLPWEEVEFCVSVFISLDKPQMKDSLYKLVLDKERLLIYLSHFGEKLHEETTNLRKEDVNSKFPQKIDATVSAHDDAVNVILSRFPVFQELYNDFELLKNIYSLHRIQSYIKLALSINLDEDKDKVSSRLVIERTLQVIGESLKNSLESPNVSEDIHQMLIYSAPSNVREIITMLRDSLSHAHTLQKRINLEENDNPRFFREIQNDLRKIEVEITDIIYKKNIEAVVGFMKKIINCDEMSEYKKLSKRLLDTDLEYTKYGENITSELALTKTLIEELDVEIKDQVGFEEEKERLNFMRDIVKSQEARLGKVQLYFRAGLNVMTQTISQRLHNMMYDLEAYKNMIRKYLETLQLHQTKPRREISWFAAEIYKRVEQKMERNSKSDRIKKLLYKIKCTVEFDASRVKALDIFKDRLEKKEKTSEKAALEKMKGIFDEIEEIITSESDRKKFKEILEDNMHKFRARENLNSLFNDLNKGSANKNDQYVLQKYEDSVTKLGIKKNKNIELNDKFKVADWTECIKIVESLGGKYQTLLNSVKNSLNTEKAPDLSSSFKRFFSLKQLNTVIDKVLNRNSDRILSYYENRLFKLKRLFSSNSGSVGNAHQLVTKYTNNKEFQSAVDMVLLDLLDILENASLFGDNRLFLDGYSPLLVGKSLRNYLAHGDVFIDSLQSATSPAIIASALLLIEANKDVVTKKTVLIGQRIEEEFDYLNTHYNQSVNFIDNKIEMFVASREGDVNKVMCCVDNGVDIHCRDTNGWTGMHYAAQGGDVDVVQYFLDRGLRVDVKDINGKSALYIAAEFKSNNIVKYLVRENHVDVKSVDLTQKPLLHYVAEIGTSKKVIEVLLGKGALVDTRDVDGSTPLFCSAKGGHEEIMLTLLENGADVDARLVDGSSVLQMAALCSHQNVVDILLQYGASVNARDRNDWSSLHMAAFNGRKDVAVTLMQNKANIDARNILDMTPLHIAAFGGKIKVVEELLRNGANPNAVNMEEMTPLHEAVLYGQKEVTGLLLDYGANVNILNKYEDSPLHTAVLRGHMDVVLALVKPKFKQTEKNKTDINVLNNKGQTPLFMAAMFGYRDIVVTLLMNGANKEASDEDGMTPLLEAAVEGQEDVVETLLEAGASVHAQNKDKSTSLHAAVYSGKPGIALMLLKYGCYINEGDIDFFTPLHAAVKKGHLEVVKALLGKGADVNARAKDFITPLHATGMYGNEEIAEVLCSHGAEVGATLTQGATPLHVSANYGQHIVARVLLKHGAKVDAVTDDNCQVLHFAAQNGYPKVAAILLDENADVNAIGIDSRTPLHLAAQNGHQDVAILLLNKGAEVNTFDKNKSSPLHLAVEKSHIEVVEVLLANEADVNGSNASKLTPLHVAAFVGNRDITKTLLENGATVDDMDVDGRTPLHFASSAGHIDVVGLLLDNKSNIDSRDSENMTPLHMAAEFGRNDVVKLLMGREADVNARDKDNRRPLHLAAQAGQTDVAKSLLEQGVEVDALDKDKLTPLHLSVDNGKKDVSVVLLQNGADFLAQNNHDDTVLHRAVSGGNEEILTILLKLTREKCNNTQILYNGVNARDANSDTPLMCAAMKGKVKVAELLLEYDADVDAWNKDSGKTALHYATESSHLQVVQILKENHANTSIKDVDGNTAYDLARKKASHEAVDREKLELILRGGHVLPSSSEAEGKLEVKSSSKVHKMPLIHVVTIKGSLNSVENLLQVGVDVDSRDETNMTPLHYSAKYGHRDVVNSLIKNKANINAQNMEEWTPLMFAAIKGHKEVVDNLLENNADVNVRDNLNMTSLHLAVIAGYTDIVKRLLKHGAKVEMRRIDNMTALHMASELGLDDVVVILLSNGAKIEESGPNKMRALHYAARNGHNRLVEVLLKKGANIESRAADKRTALHLAAENGHEKIVEVLLKKGSNVHSRAKDDMRALHYASAVGHRDVIELLLENGADISALAKGDKTAMHYAASNGNVDILEVLVDNGAEVNAQTREGMSPLHYASSRGHRHVVMSLLERGANINLRENHGDSAEDLARKGGHSEIIQTLRLFQVDQEFRKALLPIIP